MAGSLADRVRGIIAGLALALGLAAAAPAVADGSLSTNGVCGGHFVNPITDVCWDCLFPLTLGSIPIFAGDHPDGPNPGSPICLCQAPPPLFVKIGLEVGFWEPVRLEDVTEKAWCFPNLGGVSMGVGVGAPTKAAETKDHHGSTSAYHVHWYIYPVMYWLELLTDFLCLENASFDIGYLSELDPTWNDDQLASLIGPEVYLFDNPIAQASCALDCAQATATGMSNNAMYWCAGCQGSMFPLDGNIAGEASKMSGMLLAGERFAFKLHRELLAEGTSGPGAVCAKYAMPIMDKRQYRFQVVNPSSAEPNPLACPAIGVPSILWETGKIIPSIGEDGGFLIWRKRNCCVGF